jgi:hypothetical protein
MVSVMVDKLMELLLLLAAFIAVGIILSIGVICIMFWFKFMWWILEGLGF